VKPTLAVLGALLSLSLALGELPIGDAAGCVMLPFTIFVTFVGAVLVMVFAKERIWLRAIWAALILLLGLHICGGPLYYRGPEIESRVVDELDNPIEGARVVATWETTRGGMLARVTATTDRGGSFTLPAWGPRPRPPFTVLDLTQPTIEVSAPGFATAEERDDSPDERVAAVAGEQWGRREIVLYKR
jgi:hypothetical protein